MGGKSSAPKSTSAEEAAAAAAARERKRLEDEEKRRKQNKIDDLRKDPYICTFLSLIKEFAYDYEYLVKTIEAINEDIIVSRYYMFENDCKEKIRIIEENIYEDELDLTFKDDYSRFGHCLIYDNIKNCIYILGGCKKWFLRIIIKY